MRKIDIYDVIIWLSLISLIVYIICKAIGLINTPEWLNLFPLVTIVFFAGAFYQKILGFMNQMYSRTDYLKDKLENHDNRLFKLENKNR